ncbi:MAG: DUF4190 domain-containing protein [Nocardioides sp.]|nr:DUF4190 domain-containing protein [Nocardioides sp.]
MNQSYDPPPEQDSSTPPPPPPGGGYGAPYGQQQTQSGGKGMAITALVLGILAVLSFWTVLGGIVFGLIAIVLGIIGASRAKKGKAGGRGMSIAGAITGLLGVVLSGVIIAIGVAVFDAADFTSLTSCLEQAGDDQAAIDECEQEFRDRVTGG